MLTICFFAFLIGLCIATASIPVVIQIANLKQLTDQPDSNRKFHEKAVPTLGGIAIFAGTVFASSSTTDYLRIQSEIPFLTPALLLLFFVGVSDDILKLSAIKKLFLQMLCAGLLTILGSVHISSLWGMFGITDIPLSLGIILSFILTIGLINSFNLIDGVNGLAAGLGLIASTFLGIWFALTNATFLAILSFSLAGSLLGFLFFNFHNARIFMGDTGSMILGFIISVLTIKFIENNRIPGIEASPYYIKAAPGVAVAVVLIPLLDMIRVFFCRILNKKSPFSADRSHIHHILIDMRYSHAQVSFLLYTMSTLFIFLSLLLRELRSIELVLILILVAITIYVILIREHQKLKRTKVKSNV